MVVKKKFTLLELLIVLAIIGILITILLPSLSRAKEQAHRAVCASNLAQTNRALAAFAKDNLHNYPAGNPEINLGEGVFGLRNYYDANHPRQLGFLMMSGYLEQNDARILYCPSWKHPYLQYGKLSYATWGNQGGWPVGGDFSKSNVGGVSSSMEYRASIKDSSAKNVNEHSVDESGNTIHDAFCRKRSGDRRAPNMLKDESSIAVLSDHWISKGSDDGMLGGPKGSGWWSHQVGYGTAYLDGSYRWVADPDKTIIVKKAWMHHGGRDAYRHEWVWKGFFDQE